MRIKARLLILAGAAACGALLSASGMAAPATAPSTTAPTDNPPVSTSPSGSGGMDVNTPAGSASGKASVGTSGASANAGASFTDLDKGGKGYISKADAKKDKALAKQFDTLDANHDGKLDQAEFSKFETGTPNTMPR